MEDYEPRLGTVRSSQFSNCLLVKPELGKGKRSVYDLPSLRDPNVIYGRPTPKESMDIFSDWTTHVPTPSRPPTRDFVAMNKDSISHGVLSNPDTTAYRKNHVILQKIPDIRRSRPAPIPSDLDPNVTYGRKTVPARDLDLLLSHHYQAEWLDGVVAKQTKEDDEMIKQKIAARKNLMHHTKASLSHSHRNEEPTSPTASFKLKKFQSVPSKIETRRARSTNDMHRPEPSPERVLSADARRAPILTDMDA